MILICFFRARMGKFGKANNPSNDRPTVLYIEGAVDQGMYESKAAGRPVVFIFPGNSSHHRKDTTLYSIKVGGGLAAAAADLGRAGYPTLSLPTTGKKEVLAALSLSAMSDIYRAIGAGYSILLPVRAHKAYSPSKSKETVAKAKPAEAIWYFKDDLVHCPGKQPSFWGGIDKAPKENLAAAYIEFLDNLAAFTVALNKEGALEDEVLETIPEEFKRAYLDGKEMGEKDDPWLKLPHKKAVKPHEQAYLTAIQGAVTNAQVNYADWYKKYQEGTQHDHRGSEGLFSWFRHGKTGQTNAKEFARRIGGLNHSGKAEQAVNALLNNSSTRYNHHSFSSFLLDELRQIQNSPWENIKTSDADELKYSKEDVAAKVQVKL